MSSKMRFCDGVSRRDVLRVGAAGFLGGALPLSEMLRLQSQAAEAQRNDHDDVSLIILFLQGGLSTIDTLDLKPDAPPEFRGEFDPINTNVAGIQLCEHLPQVAKTTDKFSLLRNFTHNNSGHGPADHYMLTGYLPRAGFNGGLKPNNQRPAYGAVISKMLGPRESVPPYVCLPKMHNSAGAAYLGSGASPFVVNADPNAPNFSVPDLIPPFEISTSRLDARKQLLGKVDRYRKAAEVRANRNAKALSVFQQKAFELVTSAETQGAFDISQESDALRDEYGRHSLGQSCLMARRLIGAGVRCVTIDHTNWDTHNNNFDVLKNDLLPHLDSGLSSLFRDLDDRGMLEKTMVLAMGEFGRTPRVNKNAGRDHWGPANTILLGGGGIKGGRAIGATNPRGERPTADPIGPEDLAATLYRLLGINPEHIFYTPDGRPVPIVNGGKVITEIL